MASGIYQIVNIINNKRYIGSSVQLYKRKWEHTKQLRSNKHPNSYLQRAWNKYGEPAFQISTLFECCKQDLLFYEDLMIMAYNSNKSDFGYNLREVTTTNAGISTRRNTHKSGDKYNRLTLIQPLELGKRGIRKWLCRCDCGNEVKVVAGDVRHGHTKSCGCLNKERLRATITKWNTEHGPWNKGIKLGAQPQGGQ